jgi:hypothetical protein
MEDYAVRERRYAIRVPYAMQVMILYGDFAWAADVLDLSEGGCGVFRPKGCVLHIGNVARLLFFEGSGPATAVSARIARITDRHLGFEYHEPQSIPPSVP